LSPLRSQILGSLLSLIPAASTIQAPVDSSRSLPARLERHRLVRSGAVVLGLRLMISGLMFGLQMIIARVLGLSEFGVYAYAMAWVQTLTVVGKFGVDSASLRYVAAHLARGETSLLSGFLRWSEQLTRRVSLLLAVGLAILVPLLVSADQPTLRMSLWLGALLMPVIVAQAMRQSQLRAVGQIWQSLVLIAVWPALAASIASILFVALNGRVSSPMIIAAQLVSVTVCWGLATWWRSRTPLGAVTKVPGDTRKHDWSRTSLTFVCVAVAVHLKDHMGVMLGGMMMDTDAAGVLAMAERFAGVALLGVESLNLYTAPKFAAMHAKGETDELWSLVRSCRLIGLAFAVPVALAVWLLSFPLLGLIETGFQAGRPVLAVLLIGAIVRATAGPVAYALSMSGRERITLVSTLLGMGVNLVMSLLLMPRFGLMGLAMASLLTNIVWAIFIHSQWKRPVTS